MTRIHLRISHAFLIVLASAAGQAAYAYFTAAGGSAINVRTLVTSVFNGVAAAAIGYALAKRGTQ